MRRLPGRMLCALGFASVLLSGCFARAAADEKEADQKARSEQGVPVAPAGKIHTILLGTVRDQGSVAERFKRILAREIFRQAVLVTAREDYGLATRDEVLGESMKDVPGTATFEVDVLFEKAMPSSLKISRLRGSKTEVVLEQKFDKPSLNYERFVSDAADLVGKKLPDMFEQAGCSKRDVSAPADTPAAVPLDVSSHLGQMRILSQFSAVRALHQAHRQVAPSQATTAALCRAYANLGLLTGFLFHPAHKVFKARALVYADRYARQWPDDPRGWWLRGYAWSMIGMHKRALDALAKGDGLREKTAGKNSPPADRASPSDAKAEPSGESASPKPAPVAAVERPQWVELIERFCRFETDKLAPNLAVDDLKELTQVLRFVSIDACQVPAQTVEAATELLKELPECYLVHDALCNAGGVSVRHEATVKGPQIFGSTLAGRLTEIDDLPDLALRAAERNAEFAQLMSMLESAGRQAEPADELTWNVLARLLRELMFVQVSRRVDFLVYSLGVDADDVIDSMEPLLKEHPYWPFIEVRRWKPEDRKPAIAQLRDKLDTSNLDLNCMRLFADNYALNEFNNRFYGCTYRKGDLCEPDWRARVLYYGGKGIIAETLLGISPHSPFAVSSLVLHNWKYAAPQAQEWEKAYQQHPCVLTALGWRYLVENKLDDAERCLRASLALIESVDNYRQLAAVYAKRGDRARWQSTLDESLTRPDYGLDHASVRVELANYFMDRAEWDKALPYAKDAAETWAAWAMIAAMRCYEGLGQYEESEIWIRRVVERYEDNQFEWYWLCQRTGYGDLDAARQAVEQRIAKIADPASLDHIVHRATFYQCERQPERACECYLRYQRESKDPSAGLYAALLFVDAKKPAERDAALDLIRTAGAKYSYDDGKPRTSLIALAQLWSDALHAAEPAPLDLVKVEALRKTAGLDQCNFDYFTGRILQSQGRTAEAKHYLELCVKSNKMKFTRTLASVLLREPPFLDDKLQEKITPPAKENPADKEEPAAKETPAAPDAQ